MRRRLAHEGQHAHAVLRKLWGVSGNAAGPSGVRRSWGSGLVTALQALRRIPNRRSPKSRRRRNCGGRGVSEYASGHSITIQPSNENKNALHEGRARLPFETRKGHGGGGSGVIGWPGVAEHFRQLAGTANVSWGVKM